MATYDELRSLFSQTSLSNRIEVAVLIKAADVLDAGSPTARVAWATAALTPSVAMAEAKRMLSYLLADAQALTHQEILDLSDAALQSAVDAAVDLLYP